MTKQLICILAAAFMFSVYVFGNNESNLMPQLNTIRRHSEGSGFFKMVAVRASCASLYENSQVHTNHSSYQSVALWLTRLTNIIILKNLFGSSGKYDFVDEGVTLYGS
jgi:hypothetical protein